ncbi:MAG: SURF1 family cytochrome oxidase biogenesis protein [Candidatus Planktophila sp.]
MTAKIRKLFTGVAILALAALFISLGFWQLGRARDLSALQKAPIVQDQRIYALPKLTSPQGSLPVAAYGKSVAASGHYIANYKAPNQLASDGSAEDWEVALMQVDSASAILVVRGLWKDRFASPAIAMATKVEITGAIFPSQYEDRAANTPSQLSRIDSSLLTSVSGYQLYDGFILVGSETTRSGAVDRARVSIEIPQGGIPGFYWQHISYVGIWWLMAVLVLWAPFYKRREDS